MSIAFESSEVELQKLRESLRLMSDAELVKFGKQVRSLSEPRVGVTSARASSLRLPRIADAHLLGPRYIRKRMQIDKQTTSVAFDNTAGSQDELELRAVPRNLSGGC